MSLGKRLALVGLVVAVIVAIAAGVRLRGTQKAVERVMAPVEVLAPDLFPESTLLYAEVHGLDKSYAQVESWWKKFEATATCLAFRRQWDKDVEHFPPELVETVKSIDGQLQKAKEKFGYSPTTREFYELFGKHTALGLLPAGKGEQPRFLFVTRLPEGGAASLLQDHLGKAGGVRPCEPPMERGFPMFQEPADLVGTLHYGVGRGYFFISDSAAAMRESLDRLAAATDEKKPERPIRTLASDAILRRVCPTPGKNDSFVFYLKRDTRLADWKRELAPLDNFIGNAFILAPKDPAVVFAYGEATGKDAAPLRCSFRSDAPRPWTRSLPKGLFQLEMAVALPGGETRRWLEAQLKEVTDKALWKEIDALLRDTPRLKNLLTEALPPNLRPDDEILARLSKDGELIGEAVKAILESVAGASSGEFVIAAKAYPGKDSHSDAQYAFGIDLDPFTLFLAAGGLDLTRSTPDWVKREERAGAIIWSLNMDKIKDMAENESSEDNREMMDKAIGGLQPSVILTGNRLLILTGKQMSEEAAALVPGATGNSLDDDPFFREAKDQVKPGYFYLSYSKPADRLRASWSSWRVLVDMIAEHAGMEEGRLDVLHAGLATVDEMLGWASMVRAEISVSHPNLDLPGESVTLMDPEVEKRGLALDCPDAHLGAAGVLPADAWLLWTQQLQLKPAYDALRQAFVKALPGGEEKFKELTSTGDPEFTEVWDAYVDGILRNVKGEVGFAIAPPHPKKEQEGPPGPDYYLARIPAFICFSEFENPDKAFKAFETLLARAQAALNPIPFKERHKEFVDGGGEAPFGTELAVTQIDGHPALGMDFFVPVGPDDHYLVFTLGVVQRGRRILVTTSSDVFKLMGSAAEAGPDTMAGRLSRTLPPGTLPEKVASVFLMRADSIADQLRLFLDPVVPGMAGLTLQGYEGRPPQDRVQAHVEGWSRTVDLVLDLFRSGKWTVNHTSRTGNRVRTVQLRVAEKK